MLVEPKVIRGLGSRIKEVTFTYTLKGFRVEMKEYMTTVMLLRWR